MFIFGETYLKQINKLISESETLDCAVAFWGKGAENLLKNREKKGKDKTRIICNLKSGATNPEVIENLLMQYSVKQFDTLHAKVIMGTNQAIIGSANFSANGLNFEGSEQNGWEEAGMQTDNQTEVDNTKQWFENLWKISNNISSNDIRQAKILWKARRTNRPALKPLQELSIDSLKDRPIYLTIVTSWEYSREAKQAIQSVENGFKEIGKDKPNDLDWYEGWTKLPKSGTLISINYENGNLTYDGIFEPLPTLNREFTYADKTKGSIQACIKSTIKLARFNQQDQTNLLKVLHPVIKSILNLKKFGDESGALIELWRALEIAHQDNKD